MSSYLDFHGGAEDMDMGDTTSSDTTDSSSSMMSMGMKMYLHFTKGDQVLFKSIAPSSPGAIFGCCLIMFLIAIFDRYICAVFHKLNKHHIVRSRELVLVYGDNESSKEQLEPAAVDHSQRFILSHQLTRAALVGLEKTLHYLLMLVVMTFNVSYIIAIVAGAAVGEFIFGRPHSS